MPEQFVVRARMRAAAACAIALTAVIAAWNAAPAAALAPNSADRLVEWTKCDDVARLSDAELDAWKARGVDGFVCMTGWLKGMGGTQSFTGSPRARLKGSSYRLQRRLRDRRVGQRLAARGMKAYLGFYLVNYYNERTPLANWFGNRAWTRGVLPRVGHVAAAARRLGFVGVAFDSELYPQHRGRSLASWSWRYRGNRHSRRRTRAKARQRGRQLMRALVRAYPGLQIAAYDVHLPASWQVVVQRQVNHIRNEAAGRLDADFWSGLMSYRGYGPLRLLEAIFYKQPHLGTWAGALQYEMNNMYAWLSRRMRNWRYAAERVEISPFSWIDPGPDRGSLFDDAQPVAHVHRQLDEFRRWAAGGEFADYSWGGLRRFDYSLYQAAMASASAPSVVDSSPPPLSVGRPKGAGPRAVRLCGRTSDDYAVRVVRWATDRGASGTARLWWKVDSGDSRRGKVAWHTKWETGRIRLAQGPNRVTVVSEDIHGLTTARTVTVDG